MTRQRLSHRARLATRTCCLAVVLASATSLADIEIPEGPHVEIRGSLAMGAVARGVAEQFMTERPDAVVTVSGGGTYRGLKSVIVGTADMAMGTDFVPDELADMATRRQVTLESHVVFSDAVVVVVNRSNPIVSLSLRDLRDIFSGKVVRWADVGATRASRPPPAVPLGEQSPPRRPGGVKRGAIGATGADAGAVVEADIDVVTFEGNAGPYETFKKEVLGDDYVITPRAREVDFGGFEQSIGESTIGYVGLHQVGRLKALQIDGVVASADNVRSGRYPIARKLSIVVRNPASLSVTALVEAFLAKDKGQRIAESLGNVPVK